LKDFNDRSLRQDLAPLLIATNSTMYRQASIKLSTANIASSMQSIKKIWEQTFPNYVYEYRFLDDKIESFYKQENQLSNLYKIFAVIAIFLSCLGLYGLASFMAVQRIRKWVSGKCWVHLLAVLYTFFQKNLLSSSLSPSLLLHLLRGIL
jgi:hypothetical protein